jgi:hypothetical protein
VTIYRLITHGTIEEEMVQLHKDKRHLATDLLAGTNIKGKLKRSRFISAAVAVKMCSDCKTPQKGCIQLFP